MKRQISEEKLLQLARQVYPDCEIKDLKLYKDCQCDDLMKCLSACIKFLYYIKSRKGVDCGDIAWGEESMIAISEQLIEKHGE